MVVAFAVSGCSATETAILTSNPDYAEPKLPRQQAAEVHTGPGLIIRYVDGIRVARKWSVKVRSGAHAFSVSRRVFVLDVQAGGAYQINTEGHGDETILWVTDKTTGETVAGRAPTKETTQH